MNEVRIFKYPLEVGSNRVEVDGSIVRYLLFDQQGHDLFLWAEVERGGVSTVTFDVLPTGETVDRKEYGHVGSAVMSSGLVWHLYEGMTVWNP